MDAEGLDRKLPLTLLRTPPKMPQKRLREFWRHRTEGPRKACRGKTEATPALRKPPLSLQAFLLLDSLAFFCFAGFVASCVVFLFSKDFHWNVPQSGKDLLLFLRAFPCIFKQKKGLDGQCSCWVTSSGLSATRAASICMLQMNPLFFTVHMDVEGLGRTTASPLQPKENQEWPRQTKPKKGQFMNFSQGHSGTRVQCESLVFLGKTHQNSQKRARNSWTFRFGLFLVWFAGATPEKCPWYPQWVQW